MTRILPVDAKNLQAYFLHEEIAQRLMEQLSYINLKPQHILNVYYGVDTLSSLLSAQYPHADITSIMVTQNLNLAPQSVDLVITNLAVHWLPAKTWLMQIHQVLKPNGIVMMSYYGPTSLQELSKPKMPFIDMHDMGDLMVQLKFADPALHQETLQVEYDSRADAWQDLNNTGEQALLEHQDQSGNDAEIDLTYEIVYAHAWRAPDKLTQTADADGAVRIPISKIGRR